MGKRFKPNKESGLLLPHVLLRIFVGATALLIPWTVAIAQVLPSKHLDQSWDVVWTGFDIGLLISLAATAYFGLRKSGWVVPASAAAGTFLLIDAWFDCWTAKNGWETILSFSSAVLFEIPLAILAFWVTYHSGKHYFRKGVV